MLEGFSPGPLMLVVSVVLLVAFFLAILVSQPVHTQSTQVRHRELGAV